jgi:hypothetical protein
VVSNPLFVFLTSGWSTTVVDEIEYSYSSSARCEHGWRASSDQRDKPDPQTERNHARGNAAEIANYSLLKQHIEASLHAGLNGREMAVGITNRSHIQQLRTREIHAIE